MKDDEGIARSEYDPMAFGECKSCIKEYFEKKEEG